MIDDREIWACANHYLEQHGESARLVVARRADELAAAGELEGHRTYLRILDRIERLETPAPDGAVH